MRLAALKESNCAEVPKALVITTPRASPTRLLMMKATITVPAARAICWLAVGDDLTGLFIHPPHFVRCPQHLATSDPFLRLIGPLMTALKPRL
jgi:hypothetical protein